MNHNAAMLARLSAFVVWALVAGGSVFWGYRLWASPGPAKGNVQTVSSSPGAHADLTRMFGSAPPPVSAAPAAVVESNRFRLFGVVAPVVSEGAIPPSKTGVALIAIDGRPARAYKVGARVDDDLVLQAVSRRSASIGPAEGAATVVLELPLPVPPTTGTLPRAMPGGEDGRAMAQPAAPIRPPPYPTQMPRQPTAVPQPQANDDAEEDEPATPQPQRRGPNGSLAAQ